MASKLKLNLISVISPLCLLKCKSTLSRMNTGDVLEVWLQDPEVVENIEKIISLSHDQIIQTNRHKGRYRLFIEKG